MKVDYEKYRQSASERERIADLLQVMPKGRATVLDIGTRDGYIARLLTEHFGSVTALDLQRPAFEIDRVVPVAGDVTCLEFADNSFDVVCCLEVLEHIPPHLLQTACREIVRVARHEVMIGVPYRQDLRLGQTTCRRCNLVNPPWGHVNSFDECRLEALFEPMRMISKTLVGQGKERTNAISTFLLNVGGNPWGTYEQEEPCIACGQTLEKAEAYSIFRRLAAGAGQRVNQWQSAAASPYPKWVHCVFGKRLP